MRIYYFIITLIISFCVSLQAQNNANKFKQQAQSSFENKDYTKARYLYIQAYKDYANEGKITQAIECGTQAASLYHRENYYQEAVSGYAMQLKPLSIPGKRMYKGYQIKYTDTGFWKVFSFRFLTGKPFTQADFDSGITQAVVSESVARKLYGTTDVVGKTVIIDLTTYTVCGVVKDVRDRKSVV